MIEQIQRRADSYSPATIAKAVIAVVPFVVGWCVGMLLRGAFFVMAAFIEGYRVGRG